MACCLSPKADSRKRCCGTPWEPTPCLEKGTWEKRKQTHSLSVEGKWLDWRDLVHCPSSRPYTGLSFAKGQMVMLSKAGWSAATQVRERGTEKLRIVTGVLRESAVQSRSSLYSFSPIAGAVFSNV